MLTIHVWISNRKLVKNREENSATILIQEHLFDHMWEYTVSVIKEMKVQSIQRTLDQAQKYSLHICSEFDDALALNDTFDAAGEQKALDAIGGILWNELYRREDLPEDHIMEMAK